MMTSAKWISLVGLSLALAALPGCKKKGEKAAAPAATAADAAAAAPATPPAAADAAAAAAAATGDGGAAAAAGPATAVAEVKAASGSKVKGTVTFTEKDGKTEVAVDLSGLKPGKHGFHVHETGDCSAPDAKSAGGHFNPDKTQHGAPDAKVHHAGDLGNITADKKGNAKTTMTVDFLTVNDGPHSVAGHAVVVHGKADDLKSQPSGAAGPRVGCGVIEKK